MQNVEFEINQIFNNRKYCIKYMTMLHIAFKKNINPFDSLRALPSVPEGYVYLSL